MARASASAARVAVVTGSGMERLFELEGSFSVSTPHGRAVLYRANVPRRTFYVLPRHGRNHEVPPHRVNFLANLAALKKVGAEAVVGVGAVGVMNAKLSPGGMGLVDQFLDFSKRHLTFFDERVVHTDLTRPYDAAIQRKIASAAKSVGVSLARGLTYVSVDGPRYETPAEIRMFRLLGGDVVGMTGAHEAALARELGLRYAAIVVGTNYAAGIRRSVSHREVTRAMARQAPRLRLLLEKTVGSL